MILIKMLPSNRLSAWLIALACCGLIAGCGTTAPISAPTTRSSSATAAVTIQIALTPTHVIAGKPLDGTAIVTNHTSKEIIVNACAQDGWLVVGLINAKIEFDPPNPLIACAPSIRLKAGSNRFPVTIMTTYQMCANSPPYAENVPACVPSGLPPLPAGTYTTKVVTAGLPSDTPQPKSIRVKLAAGLN
jgi:hypothetical protein